MESWLSKLVQLLGVNSARTRRVHRQISGNYGRPSAGSITVDFLLISSVLFAREINIACEAVSNQLYSVRVII